ncbi:MAG: ThuA domain-containing protein, partial [Planctomycetota bacterium]
IHLNPARRAAAPGQDVIKIQLEPGDNPLVLKVANAGGRWGAMAAITGPKPNLVGVETSSKPPAKLRLAPLQDPRQQKIAAALPGAAPAKPKKARRLLVFTLTRGFRHASIPTGVEALRQLGKQTGAYEVVHSEDIAIFEKKSLEKFDGICFLSTTGELFRHPRLDALQGDERKRALARQERLQQNLIDFVNSGKGFCGIHAATDTLYKFEEYGKMIGGYFDGHPWHEKVGVKVEEPEHRLVSFFGEEFTVTDEIYQIKAPYSRFQQRVLLSLDTMRTNMKKNGIRRKDDDFPISWVKPYGEGRVFYCSLGHRDEIFWNPKVLEHYLAGIQYVLGDLKVPDEPRK